MKKQVLDEQNNNELGAEETIVPDNHEAIKVPTVNSQINANMGYSGVVTISIMHGNKIVKQTTCKNHGGYGLFRMIANAARGGTYSEISRLRPSQVCLIYSDSNTWNPNQLYDQNWSGWSSDALALVSYPVGFSSTPEFIESNNSSTCGLKFKFLIPYTSLIFSPIPSRNKATGILLLNSGFNTLTDFISNRKLKYDANYCAFIALEPDEEIELEDSTNVQKNFNILISWTLLFGNIPDLYDKSDPQDHVQNS